MTAIIEPTATSHSVPAGTMADLVHRLGDIPLARIRLHPAPGNATEDDVAAAPRPTCELIDGVLVEKAMGYFEGRLATVLLVIIENWLQDHDIGYCNGEGALTRLEFGLVRVPDVSFVRWDRVEDDSVPRDPICGVSPNLAVEVLSAGNTDAEIKRKRREYFDSKVELVWIADPRSRTVEVWSSPKSCQVLEESDQLDGGTVLPGFRLSIAEWFQRAEGKQRPSTGATGKRRKPKNGK